MTHLALFASGRGSNVQRIVEYFQNHQQIRPALIVSDNPSAPVLQIAEKHNIPTLLVNKTMLKEGDSVLAKLNEHHIDYIILAGFLKLIPKALIEAFPNAILNIHPALLPQYGGKGMYGINVHKAVKAAGEPESGITIHYVNEHYDEGEIIFQARCPVQPSDTPEEIAKKVQKLEHKHYAQVIEALLT